MELEQEVFNEGLHDENIGEFSLDDDGTFDSDSESGNSSDEQGEGNINIGHRT
jgi:hypothetical protein